MIGQGQLQRVEHRTARPGVGLKALLEEGDRLLEPAGAVRQGPCSVNDQNSRAESLSSFSARRPVSDTSATASGARVKVRAIWKDRGPPALPHRSIRRA
jgi:hypothetical protein